MPPERPLRRQSSSSILREAGETLKIGTGGLASKIRNVWLKNAVKNADDFEKELIMQSKLTCTLMLILDGQVLLSKGRWREPV